MALQVDARYETPQGITLDSTYWRCVRFSVDVLAGRAEGDLFGYTSEAAHRAGKVPVDRRTFSISGAAFAAFAGAVDGPHPVPLSTAIYGYVRQADSFFAGAKDV